MSSERKPNFKVVLMNLYGADRSFGHNVFKDLRDVDNDSHSFYFPTQAPGDKWEPASSYLHSNSLHGAQCPWTDGQLWGESHHGDPETFTSI